MEVVCCIEPALFHADFPVGMEILELLDKVEQLSGLQICREPQSSLQPKSIEIYARNTNETNLPPQYHLMLFRTLEESQIILDESKLEAWYQSVQSCASRKSNSFKKMTLFIHDGVRKASSNSAQRFALANLISRAELKYNFQVFTCSKPEEELQKSGNFVLCYIKALLKKRDANDAAWTMACKSVRVDPETKCGLRKLWMSQVMQICPPRAKQAIQEFEDPCKMRERYLKAQYSDKKRTLTLSERKLQNILTNTDPTDLL